MSAIRISGVLGRDAECRIDTSGAAWVILEVHPIPGSALAVQARRRVGTGPAAHIAAHSSAHHLRRGTPVTVHAAGCEIEQLPTPHLVLLGVDWVEHQPIVSRQEPREPQECAA